MARPLLLVFAVLTIHAVHSQPSFTIAHGGMMADDGVGVINGTSGSRVAGRVFDDASHTYAGQLWNFSTTGTFISATSLGPAGSVFIQATAAGSANEIFLAGSVIPPGNSAHDALLLKLNGTNATLWTADAPTPGDRQWLAVVALTDGGAVVCGIDNAGGDHDAVVARYSSSGSELWSVTLPAPLDQEAGAVALSGSDLMITGRQMNYGGESDCYFARLDLNGNVIWTTSWGGVQNDEGAAIVSTSSGQFVMAGTTESFTPYDNTSDRYVPHVLLIKIDLNGDTLWTRVIGDTLFDRRAFAIAQATNGDLIIGGEHDLNNAVDALVMRTDAAGHPLWQKTYGAGRWDRVLDIEALSDGFIACGWSFDALSRQVLLIRRDQQGD